MADLIFTMRRILFVQPLGMSLNMLRNKFKRRSGTPRIAPASPPIDALHGIDTAGVIPASALRTGSRSDASNFGYVGSQPSIIRRVLKEVPGLDQASFVDIGCGKGRALAAASEFPFRRIVGVELSPGLCAVARSNAARIGAAHTERTPIEVIEGDALIFEPPAGYLVVYIYNSMHAGLLKKLAARLVQHAGKVVVIYYNPASGRVFDARREFTRLSAARLRWSEEEARSSDFGNTEDTVVCWQNAVEPSFPAHPGANRPIRMTAGGAGGEV